MVEVKKLIKEFNSLTKYNDNENVLGIIFYGSRINGTNDNFSDLDVLLIIKGHNNYKIGYKVLGTKVDCQVYGIDTLYDEILEKKLMNNNYFYSIIKTGLITKNKDMIVEIITDYLESLKNTKISKRRKKLNENIIAEMQEYYELFLNTKKDYYYFNLLEMIRKSYHYLNDYSYLSLTKVYDIYQNRNKYKDIYCLKLPNEKFINYYLSAILEKDYSKRITILKRFFDLLNIDLDNTIYYQETFMIDNNLNNQKTLLIFYNKISKLEQLFKNNHNYALLVYNVLLKEIKNYIEKSNQHNKDESFTILKEIEKETNDLNKIKLLWKLLKNISIDNHFDYDNYVLKL